MRLRTLTAPDMTQAMEMAKELMGEDAVIISSMRQPTGQGVQVTVAMDDEPEDTTPEPPLETAGENTLDIIDTETLGDMGATEPTIRRENPFIDNAKQLGTPPELKNDRDRACSALPDILAFHALPSKLTAALIKKAATRPLGQNRNMADMQLLLTELLPDFLRFDPIDLAKPGCYMLVGPAGAGKTTTIAKIAAQLTIEKRKILLISTDNKRAGGVEQLGAYAAIMDQPVEYAENKAELKEMLMNADDDATILIDSFGGNPYDFQEMKELGELAGMNIITPILMLPAGMDAGEAEEVARTFSFLNIQHMIVSKTDAAKRYGAVISAVLAAGLKLSHFTNSCKAIDPIEPLGAKEMANLLIQHQRDKFA